MYKFARFEFVQRLHQPLFYVFFGLIFMFSLLPLINDNIVIWQSIQHFSRTSPYLIVRHGIMISIGGTLFAGLLAGASLTRELDNRFANLLYAAPIVPWRYVLGRFFGAFLVSLLMLSSVILAIVLAAIVREGSFPPVAALAVLFFAYLLPNVFIVSAVVFSITSLSRRSAVAPVASIALLLLFLQPVVDLKWPYR